jgi:hypothetical protein
MPLGSVEAKNLAVFRDFITFAGLKQVKNG